MTSIATLSFIKRYLASSETLALIKAKGQKISFL